MRYWRLVLILLSLLSFEEGNAQVSVASLDLDGDIESWYQNTIGRQNTPVANGSFYKVPAQTRRNHQFFRSILWEDGQVLIEGQLFDSVRLLYNTFFDELIIENSGNLRASYLALKPNQEAVESFTIQEAYFIRLDRGGYPDYGKGFYQLLYEGEAITVVVKRTKKSTLEDQEVQYFNDDIPYICVEGDYYKYQGKKTFFQLFPEHKKDIKAYIKSYLKVVKRSDEGALILLSKHCEQYLLNL